MFDPSLPATGAANSSAEMRSQLTGLKSLIDAIPQITSAQVDAVTTLPPGEAATVSANVTSGVLHLSFGVPQGDLGPAGAVSAEDLESAISTTPSNVNSVGLLGIGISDPPTVTDVQDIVNKVDELISALQR